MEARSDANKSLFLATVGFAVSFAVWGLLSGLAPILKKDLNLSATEVSMMVAVPVLLGSVGRLPMGVLTDRYGGRIMYSILLLFGIIPAAGMALNHASYTSLLFWGFWMGAAGTSFAVGIGFVTPRFPAEKQGTALGIFGAGNMGQSVAVFLGPVLALRIGMTATLLVFGGLSLTWGIVFAVWARNARRSGPPKTMAASMRVLRTEPLTWVLSLFYFLTFGGFVALGVYLPTLLKSTFSLSPEDAGARAAGFVILATVFRPIGGWLSDRVGGQRLLLIVFGGIALLSGLMAFQWIPLFTVGALGCGILFGLGNGGVFKLVPQYFPAQTGTVTGLVGAAGGLGGFFPPIIMGILKDNTGAYTLGFVFLAAFALFCGFMLWQVFISSASTANLENGSHEQAA